MKDEGYIKFTVHLKEMAIEMPEAWHALNETRTELFDRGMIGRLPDGIGFGNVSLKEADADHFFISGTATGGKRILDFQDYCSVDACSIERNEVFCSGHIRASSETLSHDAVYLGNPEIGCVIHVHDKPLFSRLLKGGGLATSPEAAYGTPEMAKDIEQIVNAHASPSGVLVMTGHEDGVIAWGRTVAEAYEVLMKNLVVVFQ